MHHHFLLVVLVLSAKIEFPILETVDQAIALLSGVPAGVKDEDDEEFREGTVNERVATRLLDMLELPRSYG